MFRDIYIYIDNIFLQKNSPPQKKEKNTWNKVIFRRTNDIHIYIYNDIVIVLLIEQIHHQVFCKISYYLQGFCTSPGGAGFLISTVLYIWETSFMKTLNLGVYAQIQPYIENMYWRFCKPQLVGHVASLKQWRMKVNFEVPSIKIVIPFKKLHISPWKLMLGNVPTIRRHMKIFWGMRCLNLGEPPQCQPKPYVLNKAL